MPAIIRQYREADLPGVMNAWETASAQAHPFLPAEFVSEVREAIPKIYIPNAETWVAVDQDEVAGFISLLGTEVGAIFVDTKHQGKGFGRQLMGKAQELKGQLEVEVFSENLIGYEFYRKYGFTQIEEKTHEPTGLSLVRLQTAAPHPVLPATI